MRIRASILSARVNNCRANTYRQEQDAPMFRSGPSMPLHSAGHRRGAVSAPHYSTVEAGHFVLREGGIAIEAMLAMAASMTAVYPHMNHVGRGGCTIIPKP